jgi:hypothetical protein
MFNHVLGPFLPFLFIREQDPLNQGLKQALAGSAAWPSHSFFSISEQDPLKYGLKHFYPSPPSSSNK